MSMSPEFRKDGDFDATAIEPETIVMAKYDVLSPNALGANLDDDTIPCVIAGAIHLRH